MAPTLADPGRRRNARLTPKVLALFDVLERYVRYPLLGLDLATLLSHARGKEVPERVLIPEQRVTATRTLIEWIY